MKECIKKIYDEDEMEKILLRPYNYLSQARVYGLISSIFPDGFDFWLRIPKDKLEEIKNILNIITHAFAMYDDVADDTLFRRNLPTTHRVFGTAITINCSFHSQLLALEKIIQLGHPKGAEIYCKNILKFVRGQGADLYWQYNDIDITHEHYKQAAAYKTGNIFSFTIQLMQLFSDIADITDYENFAILFSIYYQIRDDYVNLKKPEAVEEGKRSKELQIISKIDFCEDLTDGKLSWPVIHSLKSPFRDVIRGILKMHTRDIRTKEYLLTLLEQTGGIQHTRDVLREMEVELEAEIKRLGGNPVFEDFLNDFKNWDESASINED